MHGDIFQKFLDFCGGGGFFLLFFSRAPSVITFLFHKFKLRDRQESLASNMKQIVVHIDFWSPSKKVVNSDLVYSSYGDIPPIQLY